jgi:hypothetical protein
MGSRKLVVMFMHVDLVKEAAFSGLHGFVHLWVEFNLLDHLWQFSLPERREKDVKIFFLLGETVPT